MKSDLKLKVGPFTGEVSDARDKDGKALDAASLARALEEAGRRFADCPAPPRVPPARGRK